MGEFTVKKWRCDRCGVVHDRRPSRLYGGSARYNVKVAVDYEVTGGLEIDWSEMCDDCNEEVADKIELLKPSVKGASHG
jgi:hypothetical protein